MPNYEQMVSNIAEGVSSQNFNQYASGQGLSVNFNPELNRLTVNNVPVDLNRSGLKLQDGQLVGTEDAYNRLMSPFIEQQGLLDLEPYNTPDYLKEYINGVVQQQIAPFQYNVDEDPSAIAARKQLEKSMAEMAANRGFLYGSRQQDIVAQQFEKVAPAFEEAAYQRHEDFLNRQLQLTNVIMNWDQLQASNARNEAELYRMKAEFISQLDAREIDMFKTMLEQRRFNMEFTLEEQRFEMQKKEQEMEIAWRRVNELGYVDNETAITLGIDPGTEAGWAKKMIAEHQYQMSLMAQKHKLDIERLGVNKDIEMELISERTRVQTEAQLRLLETEHGFKMARAYQQDVRRKEIEAIKEAERAEAQRLRDIEAAEKARIAEEKKVKTTAMNTEYKWAHSQFKYRFVESGIVHEDEQKNAINWLHEQYSSGKISNPTYNRLKAEYGLPAYNGIFLTDSARAFQEKMRESYVWGNLTDEEARSRDVMWRLTKGAQRRREGG